MFSHIELNVSDLAASVGFHISVLGPLGFHRADGTSAYMRISNDRDAVITLCSVDDAHRDRGYHRRAIGLGHIAVAVASRNAVDEMAAHLRGLGIPILGEGEVEVELDHRRGYYTLSVEDPDRITPSGSSYSPR